jgi:glycosyltransferase involved in cell wall biosynthesis
MSQENHDVWIIIPAYNEATSIGSVVNDLRTNGYPNILVVDDGSRDHTSSTATNAEAIVLKHLINRGQGAALRTGIHFIAEQYKPKVIVTFDADGQHIASDIAALVGPILSGQYDVMLGSRFLNDKNTVPFLRTLILRLGIIFTNIISGVHLTDTHNGLRALGEKAYDLIRIQHRGMEHASEIIDEISRHQLRYSERPVTILYSDYSMQKGQRTSNFIKIAIKIILKKLL